MWAASCGVVWVGRHSMEPAAGARGGWCPQHVTVRPPPVRLPALPLPDGLPLWVHQVFYSTVLGVPLRNLRSVSTSSVTEHTQVISSGLTAGRAHSIIIGTDDADVPSACCRPGECARQRIR